MNERGSGPVNVKIAKPITKLLFISCSSILCGIVVQYEQAFISFEGSTEMRTFWIFGAMAGAYFSFVIQICILILLTVATTRKWMTFPLYILSAFIFTLPILKIAESVPSVWPPLILGSILFSTLVSHLVDCSGVKA